MDSDGHKEEQAKAPKSSHVPLWLAERTLGHNFPNLRVADSRLAAVSTWALDKLSLLDVNTEIQDNNHFLFPALQVNLKTR